MHLTLHVHHIVQQAKVKVEGGLTSHVTLSDRSCQSTACSETTHENLAPESCVCFLERIASATGAEGLKRSALADKGGLIGGVISGFIFAIIIIVIACIFIRK